MGAIGGYNWDLLYGGLHQKSWECQDPSDNALHTKLGPPSENRVRAGPRTIDADLRRGWITNSGEAWFRVG